MTLLPHLYEIDFWGVYDRGVPNAERIVFRALQPIELGRYIVASGVRQPGGVVRLLYDNVYWAPEVIIEPPAWVFLYTAPGKPTITVETITQAPVHALYWGKKETIFDLPEVVPTILRLDGVYIAPEIPKQLRESDRQAILPKPKQGDN